MSEYPMPFQPGDTYYLPQFPYLLPAVRHPNTDSIKFETDSWVRANMRFALTDDGEMDRLVEEGASLWTCYVLPTAQEGRLRHVCKYTEYLSVFDNAMVDRNKIGRDLDAAKALFGRVTDILRGTPSGPDFAWGMLLQDLWTRMAADFSAGQWERFMAEVERFLEGCVSEIASRSEGRVLDYDDYIKLRRDSVGMGMYFVLGEYGLDIDLTGVLATSVELRDIVNTTLEHIMLTNDLFSFRAECTMNDYVNALAVLRMTRGYKLQEAVDQIYADIDARRWRFMQSRAAIEATVLGEREDVQLYLDALWHMMAGNLHWSYLTSRYNGVGHTWNGVLSGYVTLHPAHTEFTERPYYCSDIV